MKWIVLSAYLLSSVVKHSSSSTHEGTAPLLLCDGEPDCPFNEDESSCCELVHQLSVPGKKYCLGMMKEINKSGSLEP